MSGFAPHLRHGDAEWLLLRAAFAAVVGVWFLGMEWPATQPHPNGLAHLFDLSVIGADPIEPVARAVLVALLVLYVADVALAATTAALFCQVVWIGTLSNSQGAIAHDHQIIALVLLGQTVAHAHFALARAGRVRPIGAGLRARDLAVQYSQQMIVAVYVTAGITKLLRSRGRWVLDLPDIAVEIAKTHSQRFYDRLDPGLIERGEELAHLVLAYPNLTRIVLASGLALELGAFLALRGRLAALGVGVSLVAMHQSIEWLMMLRFRANQWLVLIFLVNVPYLVVCAARWARSRRAPAGG